MTPLFSVKTPFISLLLCTALLLGGCFESNKAIPLAYPQGPLVFIGDGITAGRNIPPEGEPYPALIAETLAEMRSPLQVLNLSAEGITTTEGLMLVTATIAEHKPSTMVIALGYADMALGKNADLIANNLSSIARMGRQNGVRIVICGFGNAPLYAKLRREHQAIIIPDYLRGVKGDSRFMTDRLPYPNQEGHRLIKETVWSVLKGEIFSPVM